MTGPGQNESLLQQLLDLHDVDLQVLEAQRELRGCETELEAAAENLERLQAVLERLEAEITRVRAESRSGERAVDEKRAALDRLRGKVNQVRNQKQYGAATLEFDLVRQDLRKLEDQLLDKMQTLEDLENRQRDQTASFEQARAEAGPQREQLSARKSELGDQLAILRDRRHNLAIRVDNSALSLYDRIRSGRSQVALAPLTEEAACGNCFTAVTIQQEMQIRGMSILVCCEGCGVILYPADLKR